MKNIQCIAVLAGVACAAPEFYDRKLANAPGEEGANYVARWEEGAAKGAAQKEKLKLKYNSEYKHRLKEGAWHGFKAWAEYMKKQKEEGKEKTGKGCFAGCAPKLFHKPEDEDFEVPEYVPSQWGNAKPDSDPQIQEQKQSVKKLQEEIYAELAKPDFLDALGVTAKEVSDMNMELAYAFPLHFLQKPSAPKTDTLKDFSHNAALLFLQVWKEALPFRFFGANEYVVQLKNHWWRDACGGADKKAYLDKGVWAVDYYGMEPRYRHVAWHFTKLVELLFAGGVLCNANPNAPGYGEPKKMPIYGRNEKDVLKEKWAELDEEGKVKKDGKAAFFASLNKPLKKTGEKTKHGVEMLDLDGLSAEEKAKYIEDMYNEYFRAIENSKKCRFEDFECRVEVSASINKAQLGHIVKTLKDPVTRKALKKYMAKSLEETYKDQEEAYSKM